jgi:hypothetical protein
MGITDYPAAISETIDNKPGIDYNKRVQFRAECIRIELER